LRIDRNAVRIYSRKISALMYGFARPFKMKSVPKRRPCFSTWSRTYVESREMTIYGIRLSPTAETHAMTDTCLKLRLTLECIIDPLPDFERRARLDAPVQTGSCVSASDLENNEESRGVRPRAANFSLCIR
jgi:hypothetical protein